LGSCNGRRCDCENGDCQNLYHDVPPKCRA
jgi:hypothetical protein